MSLISFDGMRLQFSGCTRELLEMKAFQTSDNLYLSAAENSTAQEALSSSLCRLILHSHHALPLLPLPLPVCMWLLSWSCQADDALLCDGKPCWWHRAGFCARGEARPGRLLSLSFLLLPLLLSLSGLHILLLLQHLLFLLIRPDPQLLPASTPRPTVLLHLHPKTDPPARDARLCHHHHPPQVPHRQQPGLQSASCRTAPGQRGMDSIRQSQLAIVIKQLNKLLLFVLFNPWMQILLEVFSAVDICTSPTTIITNFVFSNVFLLN